MPLWALLIAAEVKVDKFLFGDEMALVRTSAFHACLAADTIAVDVLVEEFLALAAVDCLAHCSVPFFNSLISPSAAATI